MEPIIKIENLSKSYHQGESELRVFKSIPLEVMNGDYLATLGPSGSGKSALMSVIDCMDRFREGEYCLTRCTVGQLSDTQLTRLHSEKIGFIFQRYHLIQRYSVLLNTIVPLLIRGIPQKHTEELSMGELNMLGVSDRVRHKPNKLLDDQQQHATIARALVGTPELLLADEPTGALDRATDQEVFKLFNELNSMRNTIVMVTHDLSVAQHAKRTVHIIDEELYEDGQEEQAGEKELPVKAPIQKRELDES